MKNIIWEYKLELIYIGKYNNDVSVFSYAPFYKNGNDVLTYNFKNNKLHSIEFNNKIIKIA